MQQQNKWVTPPPLSNAEESLQTQGYEFSTFCRKEDQRLFLAIMTHLQSRVMSSPGSQIVVWTDGAIYRFWIYDPKVTLRPDSTLAPQANPSRAPDTIQTSSGSAGPTVRSAPPELSDEGDGSSTSAPLASVLPHISDNDPAQPVTHAIAPPPHPTDRSEE